MRTRISIIRKAYFPVTNTRTENESILEFAKAINATFEEVKTLEESPFINANDIPPLVEKIADNILKIFGLPIEFTLGYVLTDRGKSSAHLSHNIIDASKALNFCEFAKAGMFDYHDNDPYSELGSDEDGLYRIVCRDGVDTKIRLSPEEINFLLLQKDDDDEDDEDI